jgi:predicted CXXCH cytochrome family protein
MGPSLLRTLCFLLVLFPATSGVVLAVEPSSSAPEPPAEAKRSKRECAICHIMWLDDFKREEQATLVPYDPFPREETGRQDVVSTERMCVSCHDGFVLDSRFQWREGRHDHPVGIEPSSAVELPEPEGKVLFPLNDDGKVYCGTCHTPHAVRWDRDAGVSRFLRMKNVDSSLCSACHLNKSTGPDEGNHAVLEPLDEVPELLSREGAHFGADNKVICESCHRAHGARAEKGLVLAAETSQLCAACHADRTPADLEEAGRLGTHPVGIPPDHAEVPEKLLDRGAKLSRNGELICQTCHKLHGAYPGPGNLVAANVQSSLCRTCHPEQAAVSRTKHDMRVLDRPSENIRHQSAEIAGACGACHLAHGGSGPKMWARPLDPAEEPMAGLCLGCHVEGGLADASGVGAYTHPVGIRLHAGEGSSSDLPLFTHAGVKADASAGYVTCATCHDVHRPSPQPVSRTPRGDVDGSSTAFLRLGYGVDSELCRVCHRDKWALQGSEHDMAVMAPEERNVEGRRSDRAGLCGACHLVHNGRGPHMWARALSPGADPVNAACLECHREAGPAGKKPVEGHNHPIDVSLTGLGIEARRQRWRARDQGIGKIVPLVPLPLYDHHGGRAWTGGRVGCGTCHDPHRWSASGSGKRGEDPHHSEGGPKDSFLRLADDEESRLCVNCHVQQGGLIGSSHDLTQPIAGRQEDMEVAGEKPGSPCGACHRSHDAGEAYLWARQQGPGKTRLQRLCADCHRAGGVAEEKLTGVHGHPVGVPLDEPRGPIALPLYAKDGRHPAKGGNVDCATCHDPHQREPRPKPSSSADTSADAGEGDAGTGYLRMPAAPSGKLCIECHRQQAAVRGTDHDLRITAPQALNTNRENVHHAGICGACHAVHNATDDAFLSAVLPAGGADKAQDMCLGCHARGRAAEAKVPLETGHPRDVSVWSGRARGGSGNHAETRMPVYDVEGRPVDIGLITCTTCHDPHRWRPGRVAKGQGRKSEGDVLSSFLRLDDTKGFMCADCHGLDSLFRYKYYHSEGVHR